MSKMCEATGTLVPVDMTVFLETVKYFSEQDLIDSFSKYLKDNGINEVVMDVCFANHIKKFLASNSNTMNDSKAAVIIACGCGSGCNDTPPPRRGGGGVRG